MSFASKCRPQIKANSCNSTDFLAIHFKFIFNYRGAVAQIAAIFINISFIFMKSGKESSGKLGWDSRNEMLQQFVWNKILSIYLLFSFVKIRAQSNNSWAFAWMFSDGKDTFTESSNRLLENAIFIYIIFTKKQYWNTLSWTASNFTLVF